ncbi:MAG: MerR family DNA-binding transcriptional regulator [Anaerolineales bacterium]|nr:MerR family DNA-binding transcriptional regulator [Anaerolineales bacterium]
MPTKYLRTSDLARAAGIHPNTVRLYVEWGLIPPVERSPSGYRLFTQHHLDCVVLARTIYECDYPGRALRSFGNEIIQHAVKNDWQAALEKAHAYLCAVKAELQQADTAANVLETWAQNIQEEPVFPEPLAISRTAELLGVSRDMIRNWERNGLIKVPRNPDNNYRLFGKIEFERLRIIRMLARAGYSHMAILRMFLEMDRGNTDNLKQVLDTPHSDEDIFIAADHWLTTLHNQQDMALNVIRIIEDRISAG